MNQTWSGDGGPPPQQEGKSRSTFRNVSLKGGGNKFGQTLPALIRRSKVERWRRRVMLGSAAPDFTVTGESSDPSTLKRRTWSEHSDPDHSLLDLKYRASEDSEEGYQQNLGTVGDDNSAEEDRGPNSFCRKPSPFSVKQPKALHPSLSPRGRRKFRASSVGAALPAASLALLRKHILRAASCFEEDLGPVEKEVVRRCGVGRDKRVKSWRVNPYVRRALLTSIGTGGF